MKNKKLINTTFLIFCFTLLMTFHKNKNKENIKIITKSIRNLLSDDKITNTCNKAHILDKFQGEKYIKDPSKTKLTKYQNELMNLIDDSDLKYIKHYLPHLTIFFIFIALDIFIIAGWIIYCACCCCCTKCIFKQNVPNSLLFRTICFFVSIGTAGLSLIFAIVCICIFLSFKRRINGIACSIYKTVDHFTDGVNPDYNGIDWKGTSYFINNINQGQMAYLNLSNDTQYIIDKLNADKEFDLLANKSGLESSYKVLNDSYFQVLLEDKKQIKFDKSLDHIVSVDNTFRNIENDYFDDIYDAVDTAVNKYIKRIFLILFIVVIGIIVIGIACIVTYVLLKWKVSKIIYIIIWNIEMLLVILLFIIAALFGILGYLTDDLTPVFEYIRSEGNLNSENPKVINLNEKYSNYINLCLNENGIFQIEGIAQGIEEEQKKMINSLAQLKNDIDNANISLNESTYLNDQQKNATDKIQKGLLSLKTRATHMIEYYEIISNFIGTYSCHFISNDIGIIENQLDSAAKKSIALAGIIFCIAALLGISVFFGILTLNKFHPINDNNNNNVTIKQINITENNNSNATVDEINKRNTIIKY